MKNESWKATWQAIMIFGVMTLLVIGWQSCKDRSGGSPRLSTGRFREERKRIKGIHLPATTERARQKNKLRAWQKHKLRELAEFAWISEDLPEIKWVWIESFDTVWVGFDPWPEDGRTILRGGLVHITESLDDRILGYAVSAASQHELPTEQCYAWACAKGGRITDSSE